MTSLHLFLKESQSAFQICCGLCNKHMCSGCRAFGPFTQVTFVITSRLDKQRHLHIKTRISNGGQRPDGNLRFPRVNHNEMVYPFITTSKIKASQVSLSLSVSFIVVHSKYIFGEWINAGLCQKGPGTS